MYFHLIWIKEKNWKQNDLDILLQWDNEDFIRKFLSYWWVVIVSLEEFKDDSSSFGNIKMITLYNSSEIEILINWENLYDSLYYLASLWLKPKYINFVNNPVDESEVNNIIASTVKKIEEEDKLIQKEKDIEKIKEQKKYEESSIWDWLKAINTEIDRIWQILKAWEWVLLWSEIKHLEDYLNEMKKIRLGTNFNKMATLVVESHKLSKEAEERIFSAYQNGKFLIDNNSYVTNIDIISESFESKIIKEKSKLWSSHLSTSESFQSFLWPIAVFLKLLWRDFVHTINDSSVDEIFKIVMNLLEYLVLVWIVIFSLLWLIAPLFWLENFSLYLLPAFWWLALLLYLFNSLQLKWSITKIIWFIVLVLVYWRGLILLLNTFSM